MKILSTLLATGLCALLFGQTRPPITYDRDAIAKLAARLNALSAWRDGFDFGNELAALPSPLGYQILRDNWNKGASLDARKQIFKGFVFNEHPDSLLVLNLGMHDPHLPMQSWAMDYLRSIAYVDFGEEFGAYPEWFARHRGQSVAKARAESLREAFVRVAAAGDADLETRAGGLAGAYQGAKVEGVPGLPALAERLAGGGPNAHRLALALLASRSLDAEASRRVALRIVDTQGVNESLDLASLVALGDPAVQARLRAAIRTAKGPALDALVTALAKSDDPGTVPFLIGLFDGMDDDGARQLGYVLASALGASSGSGQKGAWWKAWYAANRARFEMKWDESALPSFPIDAVAPEASIPDADDVRAIPSRSFFVGGDRRMRYLVAGEFRKGDAKRVLLVLPGGDGSAEFHPFVKRIDARVLDKDWIVVQPVAPKWDDKGDRVVWPSVGVPYPAAGFTTEAFLDGILDELTLRHGLKVVRTDLLAWSSSGPAVYSYAAHGRHKVDGAFVAMAVFRPDFLGGAKALNVGRFFLYHSPEDPISMTNPEAAKADLEARGVPVRLLTYPGGHGWTGPVWKDLASGLAYLRGG